MYNFQTISWNKYVPQVDLGLWLKLPLLLLRLLLKQLREFWLTPADGEPLLFPEIIVCCCCCCWWWCIVEALPVRLPWWLPPLGLDRLTGGKFEVLRSGDISRFRLELATLDDCIWLIWAWVAAAAATVNMLGTEHGGLGTDELPLVSDDLRGPQLPYA